MSLESQIRCVSDVFASVPVVKSPTSCLHRTLRIRHLTVLSRFLPEPTISAPSFFVPFRIYYCRLPSVPHPLLLCFCFVSLDLRRFRGLLNQRHPNKITVIINNNDNDNRGRHRCQHSRCGGHRSLFVLLAYLIAISKIEDHHARTTHFLLRLRREYRT